MKRNQVRMTECYMDTCHGCQMSKCLEVSNMALYVDIRIQGHKFLYR